MKKNNGLILLVALVASSAAGFFSGLYDGAVISALAAVNAAHDFFKAGRPPIRKDIVMGYIAGGAVIVLVAAISGRSNALMSVMFTTTSAAILAYLMRRRDDL